MLCLKGTQNCLSAGLGEWKIWIMFLFVVCLCIGCWGVCLSVCLFIWGICLFVCFFNLVRSKYFPYEIYLNKTRTKVAYQNGYKFLTYLILEWNDLILQYLKNQCVSCSHTLNRHWIRIIAKWLIQFLRLDVYSNWIAALNSLFLPHQVKTQYLHFRFHANYFLFNNWEDSFRN